MNKRFQSPEEAEAAFYDAIERADMSALDDIWSNEQTIVCVHPGSSRIVGREAVMQSFADLFSDAPLLDFSIVDTLYTGNDSMAVHLVREEIALDGQMISVMLSTNIYHLENGGWRMVLHHASPEPDSAFDDDIADHSSVYHLESGHLDFEGLDEELDDSEALSRPPVLH